jgi:DNA-binding NtrC family response regulator
MYDKTVLLVDDNRTTRLVFTEILRLAGVVVVQAENAHHALKQLSEGIHIDAIISDYMMPGMNGIELAKALNGRYPLMLVSSDDLEKKVNTIPTIVTFCQKPLTPEELLEGVRKLFAVPDAIK